MKKILLLLVSLAFIISSSGCGAGSELDPDKPVTLTLWHVYGEQADSPMNRLVDEFMRKRNHIISQIDSMENTDYYHVLSMRYVNQNTFEEIAQATNWSIRKIFTIHGRALQEFERLYGKEYLENVQ